MQTERKNDYAKDFIEANVHAIRVAAIISQREGVDFQITEHLPTEFFQTADKKYGCDGFIFKNGKPKHGVAVRVQPLDYSTFTIRCTRARGTATEYEKRVQAIHGGELYPKYTLQAYVKPDGSLRRLAMVDTKQLYLHVEENFDRYWDSSVTTYDGNRFLAVPFADCQEAGMKFLYYQTGDLGTNERTI
jgi:hypothetical protein